MYGSNQVLLTRVWHFAFFEEPFAEEQSFVHLPRRSRETCFAFRGIIWALTVSQWHFTFFLIVPYRHMVVAFLAFSAQYLRIAVTKSALF